MPAAARTKTKPTPIEVVEIPIGELVAGDNVRTNPGELAGLTMSIASVGILEPLIVEPFHDGPGGKLDRYRLIAGHRRLAAAKDVKLKTCPCIVRHGLDDARRAEAMLVENLQRQDLSHTDQARGFQRLVDLGWSQRKIAERVGVTQPHISKHVRLLALPGEALTKLDAGSISMEDALALTALVDREMVVKLVTGNAADSWRGISGEVDAIRRETERKAEVDKVRANLEKKGLKVVGRYNYSDTLERLELPEKSHAKEPCHAAGLQGQFSPVRHELICTDPLRHHPEGGSKLKSKTYTSGKRLDADLTAADRARQEATNTRRELCRQLLVGKLARQEIVNLILTDYLQFSAQDDPEDVCELLGATFEEDKGDAWQAIEAYAAASEPNLLRAAFAAFLSGGEEGYFSSRIAYLRLLIEHGYKPIPQEQQLLDEWAEAEQRDKAAEAASQASLEDVTVTVNGEEIIGTVQSRPDDAAPGIQSDPQGADRPALDDPDNPHERATGWVSKLKDQISGKPETLDGTTDDEPDPRRHAH